MDITYVRIVIRGIIKNSKLNISRAGRPRKEQKRRETERTFTYTVNFHVKRKKCTTYGHHICMYYH